MFASLEQHIHLGVQWLRLAVELIGAAVVAAGALAAAWGLVRHWRQGPGEGAGFNPVRLQFARYLTLALEFQLAADILSTAVAPSWQAIGKLAAIATIRTVLNFFLEREIHQQLAREDRQA